MPLINCPDCGKQISAQASICPNCSRPMNPKPAGASAKHSPLRTILIVAGILVVVVVGLGFLTGIYVFQQKHVIRASREAAVIQQLETLRKVQAIYALQNKGLYGTFDQLRKSQALEDDRFAGDSPVVDGYAFTMKTTPAVAGQAAFYSINADPVDDPTAKHFYLDPDISAIRVNEDRPAMASDPPLTK